MIAGVGILLIGILTLLLAIMVRIWWVTYTNRTLLPAILDAYREREGKPHTFLNTDGSRAESERGND